MSRLVPTATLAALALIAPAVRAASTAYWDLSTFGEFLKGKFRNVSLTRDGRLTIGPRIQSIFDGDQPVIWSIANAGTTYYVATGHRGEVFRVDASGKPALLWTAPEPEVFAITTDRAGVLYAATSPDGKIYRIAGGTATEYFVPKTRYTWALAFGPDNALYAATGDEGKIFRITGPNQGEVYYETGQTHVTCLAFDREKRLLAGTEPNGILYRITAKDRAFVLYDAVMPEIRAVVPHADGSIYLATLGGSPGKKGAGAAGAVQSIPTGPVISTTVTSITVTDEAARAQQGRDIKPQAEPAKPAAATAVTGAPAATTPLVDYATGLDKSALIRIHPDNLIETLWVSKEENIYDLVPQGARILFSTDKDGRIYRLESDRKATLLIETREGEATRLSPLTDGFLAATSHAARLFRVSTQAGAAGSYEAPVHDAGAAARWGRLTWVADTPRDARMAFRTRSGNSAKPDKTWSDWSTPLETSGTAIASPNARYLQWQVEFTAGAAAIPHLDAVTAAYLPRNQPPTVKGIQVTSLVNTVAAAKAASAAATAAYTITVSDSSDAPSNSTGTPVQTVSRPASGQIALAWQADDPDQDRLTYSVYFRGEDERAWKLLKKDLADQTLTLDGDSLADGRYLFRVVASDTAANPPGQARESDLVSAPALIDNTPPQLTATAPRRNGESVEFEVEAVDQASVVKRAETSIDAGPWTTAAVEDGIADSKRERILVRLTGVPPGEHLAVVRVFDTAGNSATIKVTLR